MKKVIGFLLVFLVTASMAQSGGFTEKEGKIYLNNELYSGTFKVTDGDVVTSEYDIKDGLKHGDVKHYYANGDLKEKGNYHKGEKHGTWQKWNEDGRLISEAHYNTGQKEGAWLVWDENGTKRYEMYYSNGSKTGEWKIWNEEGLLTQSRSY